MGFPAARLTDLHVCPMVTGIVPHVGGPIAGPGCPTVLIGGLPAARVGDLATCVGPSDTIVKGSSSVFIGGSPAARMLDTCSHGGAIVLGCFTVLIGDTAGGAGAAAAGAAAASGADALDQTNRAPDSATRPELEKIANDKTVQAAIDKAWSDSNPNGPGVKQEHGFWIMQDNKTRLLSVKQFPSEGSRNDRMIPGPTPADPGSTPVAFFHTHPNTAADGYLSGPSDADVRFANARNMPGIIKSHDGMYYFGP